MFKNPFSFEGRIRRTEYGLSIIICYAYAMLVGGFIGMTKLYEPIMWVLLFPAYWFVWAQGAKRCHDRGNSGWYQIIPFLDYACCLRTAIMESMNMAQIQKELEICNMQPKTIALLIKTAYGCG